MRLAEYIDCTLPRADELCREPAASGHYRRAGQLSNPHLMKIVNDLARQGVIQTTLGRGCGLGLLRDPTEIRVGEVVRNSETNFRLVESFDGGTNN